MPYRNNHEILFHRHERNPILTAAVWPYPANSVFNPGAVRTSDGSTVLLCRVEDRRGHSHLAVARSADGISGWQIDPEPSFAPDPGKYPEELSTLLTCNYSSDKYCALICSDQDLCRIT